MSSCPLLQEGMEFCPFTHPTVCVHSPHSTRILLLTIHPSPYPFHFQRSLGLSLGTSYFTLPASCNTPPQLVSLLPCVLLSQECLAIRWQTSTVCVTYFVCRPFSRIAYRMCIPLNVDSRHSIILFPTPSRSSQSLLPNSVARYTR